MSRGSECEASVSERQALTDKRQQESEPVGESKRFFEASVGPATHLAVSNYMSRGLPGRMEPIKRAHERATELFGDEAARDLSKAWACVDLVVKTMGLFDDLGAAVWAGKTRSLREFGTRLTTCRGAEIDGIYKTCIEDRGDRVLEAAWGFPTVGSVKEAYSLTPGEIRTLVEVRDATVKVFRREMKRIGRLRDRYLPLYNKFKHAAAAVLVNLQRDKTGEQGLAVWLDLAGETPSDRGRIYPATAPMLQVWGEAADPTAMLTADMVAHRKAQIRLRTELFLPDATLGVSDDMQERYSTLKERLFGQREAIDVNLNLVPRSEDEPASRRWFGDPLETWRSLGEG